MGTLHLAVNVFALLWKTPHLLKLKKIISSHDRTLSGHTWSTAKKFFILNLSSLHPYGKPYLGYTARRWFTLLDDGSQLLGNSSRWSNHEFDCSALFAPTRTCSRRHCTTDTRHSGTSYGGTTLDTHGRPHGLRPQGRPSPQDEALRGTTLLGASRKTPGRHLKDTTRFVRIHMIP